MISTCDPHITLISFFFTCFSRVQYYHTSFPMPPSSFYAFPNASSSFNSNQIIKNLPFFPHQIPHFLSPPSLIPLLSLWTPNINAFFLSFFLLLFFFPFSCLFLSFSLSPSLPHSFFTHFVNLLQFKFSCLHLASYF